MRKSSILSPLVLLFIWLLSAPASAAAKQDHLYVSLGVGGVARYHLTNGIPDAQPDLTYVGQAPFGVGFDGTVVATLKNASYSSATLAVYPPNSNRASRIISLPDFTESVIATGVQIDPHGYIFISYFGFLSSARDGTAPLFGGPYVGIFKYGPSKRDGRPLMSFTEDNAYYVYAFAMDKTGALYVPTTTLAGAGSLDVVPHPERYPNAYRNYPQRILNFAQAMATNDSSFFVLAKPEQFSQHQFSDEVYSWPLDAKPSQQPSLVLEINPKSNIQGIAASGTYLYGALYDFKEVGIYKLGAGALAAPPFATLPAEYPNGIALGP